METSPCKEEPTAEEIIAIASFLLLNEVPITLNVDFAIDLEEN